MVLKLLQEVNEESQKISSDCLISIQKKCNEDRDIEKLVWYLLTKFKNNSKNKTIQSWLQRFIADCGYDVQRNPYHSTSTLYNLDHFLGNYFYDDSEAIFVESDNWFKEWKISNSLFSKQATPKDFTEKAIENMERSTIAIAKIRANRKVL